MTPGNPKRRSHRALPLHVFAVVFAAAGMIGCAATAPRGQGNIPALTGADSSRALATSSSAETQPDSISRLPARAGGEILQRVSPGDSTSAIARREGLIHAIKPGAMVPARLEPGIAATDSTGSDSLRTLAEGMGEPVALDSARIALLQGPGPETPDSARKQDEDIDTSIVYGGKELLFDVHRRTSIIRGNAKIVYKDMTLTANEILVDWERDLMTAIPELDTLWTDSTQTSVDSVSVIGMPTFVQGKQGMSGMLMRVNMKNRSGYVESGTTKYGDGFYRGKRIQKVSDDVFFVQGGMYTSCNAPVPHYKFTGAEMKMIRGDKVVGKPIVLRFGDVPVAALPFAVFSIKPGRHSGILIPTYGDDSRLGRRFVNLGYYWAASDYWDTKGVLDYFEESGFRVRGDLVYNKRYAFTGGTSASYKDEHNNKVYWDLRTRHRQTIDPYTTLNVDGTFVSRNDFYSTQSQTADQLLKQQITSNATLNRRWPNSGTSLSINARQDRNLRTGANTMTLPSFNLSFANKQLFPSAAKKAATDKTLIYSPPKPRLEPGEERPEDKERWYNTITYRYTVNGSYKQEEELSDPRNFDTTLVKSFDQAISHHFNLSAPQQLFNYIRVSPSFNYKEDWLFRRRSLNLDPLGAISYPEERGFYRRFTFSSGIGMSTTLYGMFPVQRWGVEMFRHVLSPSVSFSWRPDFSESKWNYYQHADLRYFNPADSTYRFVTQDYDRYTNTIAGGTPRGKQMAANFSLDNIFQMKTLTVDAQGKEEEKKFELFKVNMSSSYNFAADSLKFSDLRTRFSVRPISENSRIGPLKSLDVDISTTHSFYAYDTKSKRVTNTYYWERPKGKPGEVLRLIDLSSTAHFALDIENPFVKRKSQIVIEGAQPDTVDEGEELLKDIRNEFDTRFTGPEQALQTAAKGGALQIRGSLTYRLSKSNPLNPQKTIFLNGGFSLKLTRNWTFNYSTGVDLVTRQVSIGTLSVGRDLHCWSGTFTWSPRGITQGFYLRIGIKTPQLSDIKLEQRRGVSGPTF